MYKAKKTYWHGFLGCTYKTQIQHYFEQLIEILSKYNIANKRFNSSEYNVKIGMGQFAHGSDETLVDKEQSHRWLMSADDEETGSMIMHFKGKTESEYQFFTEYEETYRPLYINMPHFGKKERKKERKGAYVYKSTISNMQEIRQ
jgi:hypothetical protein